MNKIYNILKYKDHLLSAVLFAIIASFFFIHTEYSFDTTTAAMENTEVIKFRSTDEIVQKLNIPEEILLTKVSIQFGTYAKNNQGLLYVQLYEDQEIIEEWKINTSGLADNDYQGFPLDRPFKTKTDSSYSLHLSEDFSGDNAIAVWTAPKKDPACFRNGLLINGRNICYQLDSTNIDLKRRVLTIAAAIALFLCVLLFLQIDETVIMCVTLVVLGSIYMWLCPPGIAPDENNHFYRAFEISCGNLLSRCLRADGVGGDYLPSALEEYQDPHIELDWDRTEEISFSNTALYAPVSYLPQAVGIKIARYFTDNVSKIFYAGKYGNFLASLLLSVWALYRIPFGKRILFMIMTFPMTMQEMVSMSTDGCTTALCLAFTAYILYLSYNSKDKLRKREICLVAILSASIALCKIIYIVLVLLIFIIPNKKIGERPKWIVFKAAIPGTALLLNLIWLKISSGYLIEFQPGVAPGKQAVYILSHLGEFYAVVVRSIIQDGCIWIHSMFGSTMGALNITISSIAWTCFLILFLYEICTYKRLEVKPHAYDQIVMALIFLSGAALICASLYVQWTPLKSGLISGVQGRYFIPLIIFPAFFVMYANDKAKKETRYIITPQKCGICYYTLLLVINGITILDMIHHSLNN